MINEILDYLQERRALSNVDIMMKTYKSYNEVVGVMKKIDANHQGVLMVQFKEYSNDELLGENIDDMPCNRQIPYNRFRLKYPSDKLEYFVITL